MTFAIKVRGPGKTGATLSQEQFDGCEDILVKLMNQELSVKAADAAIAVKCEEVGLPLQFA
ncbi:hypothetical protein [Noviherbaspirillum pedocola]|uniref:Uncharacterized protein n=1 Tax=Noviherbaspirillum pedocola TaxID=2801341 RepID=A0A934W6A9_9BURK|nr:hypothetical protein [Noviherbaspirillum pedocola]MBK4735987.1 hypothetical protein [Noviherbaspirillum pedocola]